MRGVRRSPKFSPMTKTKPLPSFEGTIPESVTYTASGSITEVDDQPDGCPTIGEWLNLECIAQVVDVNHKLNNDGDLTRVVKVKMDTMRTLPAREADDEVDEVDDFDDEA